jgi:hypothetical protein
MMNTKWVQSALLWGFVLWLFGYIAGILLFFFVPKDYIGWILTPAATALTVWVILKRIKQPTFVSYFGISLIWTAMAMVLDYTFLVTLFKAQNTYYKPDVFLYYILTFVLPMLVGYWKLVKCTPLSRHKTGGYKIHSFH